MKVTLKDVRITFPELFEAKQVQGQGEAKFKASFLFPAGSQAEKDVKAAIMEAAKEKWAAKHIEVVKSLKAGDKLCLHDGAAKTEYDGYEGMLYISASNKLRPTVVDGNRSPLTMADGKPYSGCYVNAIVEIWAQDNKHGKRVNASLQGVQFLRDGERLAGGSVASEDDFEAIPGAEGGAAAFADDSIDPLS